jgi:hypothetical protein
MNTHDDNQGRGPDVSRASGLDWILAVAIGTCLALAAISWCEEPEPGVTWEAK